MPWQSTTPGQLDDAFLRPIDHLSDLGGDSGNPSVEKFDLCSCLFLRLCMSTRSHAMGFKSGHGELVQSIANLDSDDGAEVKSLKAAIPGLENKRQALTRWWEGHLDKVQRGVQGTEDIDQHNIELPGNPFP